jgi:hypothetical protein
MKSTPTLARITALYEERCALWGRTGRLGDADRGRLLDIAEELESLWNKRRLEKARIDADRLPDLIVHPYEPDGRRTRWTRRRGRAKRGSEGTPWEREVTV